MSASNTIYKFNIKGSKGNIYQATIFENNNQIFTSCNCMAHGKCKHIVELLAGVSYNLDENSRLSQTNLISHLLSFSNGIKIINKARRRNSLAPYCEKCKSIKQIHQDKFLLFKLISKIQNKIEYNCTNCN